MGIRRGIQHLHIYLKISIHPHGSILLPSSSHPHNTVILPIFLLPACLFEGCFVGLCWSCCWSFGCALRGWLPGKRASLKYGNLAYSIFKIVEKAWMFGIAPPWWTVTPAESLSSSWSVRSASRMCLGLMRFFWKLLAFKSKNVIIMDPPFRLLQFVQHNQGLPQWGTQELKLLFQLMVNTKLINWLPAAMKIGAPLLIRFAYCPSRSIRWMRATGNVRPTLDERDFWKS